MKYLFKKLNTILAGMYTQERVFQNYASGDVTYPYVIFRYNGSGEVETYATTSKTAGYVQEHDILIQYISKNDSDATDNLEMIIDSLHNTSFDIETYYTASVWMIGQDFLVDPEKSPEGDPIYIASAVFSFKLIRKGE